MGKLCRRAFLILVTMLVFGCAVTRRSFVPVLPIVQSSEGRNALMYQLYPRRNDWGEALLWSRGIYQVNKHTAPMIEIKIEIRNISGQSLVLSKESLELKIERAEGGEVVQKILFNIPDSWEVAARSSRTFLLIFPLPGSLKVSDVASYLLRWTVATSQESYSQETSFREFLPDYSSYCNYYGPYFYDGPYYPGLYQYRVYPYGY